MESDLMQYVKAGKCFLMMVAADLAALACLAYVFKNRKKHRQNLVPLKKSHDGYGS